MSWSYHCREIRLATMVVVCLLFCLWGGEARCGKASRTKNRPVWVVLFSSAKCPRCSHVDTLIQALQKKYPLKIRRFGIDKPEHYALFQALEAIHGEQPFGVPLVIIGESILLGESEIKSTLEETVKGLSMAGGSGLPYLGPFERPRSVKPGIRLKSDQP